MRALRRAWLLLAIALLVVAGCSDDQTTAPARPAGIASLRAKSIGPSEVVLAVDVSDSISAGELQAVTSALQDCLLDAGLVPQDGSVRLGLIVYGDTIASVIAPSVPVTAGGLQEIILPALAGLTGDRLVGGAGFDLAGALEQAHAILGASQVSDRHVLIAGSGAADDAGAVGTACAALEAAGVMISALAVAPSAEGATLLKGCVQASGGFYGAGEAGFDLLCADALRYMLLVEIDLVPESAEVERGAEHTVTAMVFRGGEPETYPLSGLEVAFAVIAGPNAGLSATAPSDTAGAASFAYVGDGGPGVDTIVAQTAHPGTGVALTDTVAVTWANTPPDCDAGGPYAVVVRADTVRVTLDGSGSTDADGDTLIFAWSVDCQDAKLDDATLANPVLTLTGACLCVESLTVEVAISDGFDTSVCGAEIEIQDRRPPVVEMVDGPLWTWPPNHLHQAFAPGEFILSAHDACGEPIDPATAIVVEIRSDEPEDERGDGATLDDIRVECPNLVKVRAERAGGSNGRIYTIVYRVSDEDGNYVDVEAQVAVPHDMGWREAVLDEGMGYTYRPECKGID